MSLPRLLSTSIFGLFTLVATTGVILAQTDQSVPEVENSLNAFEGRVDADAVYVRSGPGEDYYPTMKLDAGAAVTVVGHKFDWLKIVPPPGSFSFVAKMYVTPSADGKTGTVTHDVLNVRAGSSLNDLKRTVHMKLNTGDTVKILDEVQEYYKIEPPAGAFLYIKKDFIKPVRALTPAETPGDTGGETVMSDPIPAATAGAGTVVAGNALSEEPPVNAESAEPVATTSTPAPTTAPAADATETTAPATTQPAGPTVTEQFDKIEADFLAISKLDLKEQPLDPAIADYEALLATNQLPESMRRIADARLATLKVRKSAMDQYAAAQKLELDAASRQQALAAEKDELNERIKENQQTYYSAVGTLQTSSLQGGPLKLYRLTDPNTGRTVLYLRTDDTKYAGMLGQFIGVRGTIETDTQKKILFVQPTDAVTVDPSGLGSKYSADMVPPSLLGRGTTP